MFVKLSCSDYWHMKGRELAILGLLTVLPSLGPPSACQQYPFNETFDRDTCSDDVKLESVKIVVTAVKLSMRQSEVQGNSSKHGSTRSLAHLSILQQWMTLKRRLDKIPSVERVQWLQYSL